MCESLGQKYLKTKDSESQITMNIFTNRAAWCNTKLHSSLMENKCLCISNKWCCISLGNGEFVHVICNVREG